MEPTGRTVTRMVASRATIRDIVAKVNITRYSCFCGLHSAGTSLTASTSSAIGMGGFSLAKDNVEVRLSGSQGGGIVL
jgi:hypothetical protein